MGDSKEDPEMAEATKKGRNYCYIVNYGDQTE